MARKFQTLSDVVQVLIMCRASSGEASAETSTLYPQLLQMTGSWEALAHLSVTMAFRWCLTFDELKSSLGGVPIHRARSI